MLPLGTMTRIYMTGTLRTWVHYLCQRLDPHAQLEHRDVAESIAEALLGRYPALGRALAKLGRAHPDYQVFAKYGEDNGQ